MVVCPNCRKKIGIPRNVCPYCGVGLVIAVQPTSPPPQPDPIIDQKTCSVCLGTGTDTIGRPCKPCRGKGYILIRR